MKTLLKNNGQLISSILLALFFDCKSISDGLISLIGFSTMKYIYMCVAVASILLLLIKREVQFYISAVIILFTIILYYILSINISSIEPIYFAVYFILPFIFSMFEYDWEVVLRYTSSIVVPLVIFQDQIFALNEINNNIEMGTSYMFLAPIIAAYIHFRYYRSTCSRWIWVTYLVNLFYLWKIIQFGSRGPILAVALTIIISIFVSYDKEKNRFNIKWLRFIVSAILVVVVVVNFDNILIVVQRVLSSMGLSFRFITKMLTLSQEGDISNGRSSLLIAAYEGWLERPLFGHGISTFEYYTGNIYPHNFFMQFLFDGGIILTLAVLVPIVINVKRLLLQIDYNQYISLLFISMISIPGALFSGDLFENYRLWIFIFFILNNTLRNYHNDIFSEVENEDYYITLHE